MNLYRYGGFSCFVLLTVAGCATPAPVSPHVAVMPAPGKPFDQFVIEERSCRDYADRSIGNATNNAANNAAGTAVAGAIVGTAAGALLGGREGAPIGAGMGLIAGSAAGSSEAEYSSNDIQWRYDTAYKQCMYAKGNQVPGYAAPRTLPPPPPMN